MNLTGLDAWLHCLLTPGLGAAHWLRVLQRWGEPEQALAASHAALSEVLGATLARRLLSHDSQAGREAVHDWLALGEHRQLLRLDDRDYPVPLLHSPTPPPLLFLHGQRALLSRPMSAVVGSRWFTHGDFSEGLIQMPGEGAWPITMGTYVVLPKVAADTARTARALRFFVWAYGRGDALARQAKFVPLPEKVQASAFRELSSVVGKNGEPIGMSAVSVLVR